MKQSKKYLTERQAWRFLQKRFEEAAKGVSSYFTIHGLCHAASALYDCALSPELSPEVSREVYCAMDYRIHKELIRRNNGSYLFPRFCKEGHRKRAALCRKFAERCK